MDWKIPSKDKVNALLVVAHPDDETIFCGGTMLYYPDWTWTVVCMTWSEGTDRYNEFQNAMESFKKRGVNISSYFTLGHDEINQGKEPTQKERLAWEEALKKQNFSPDITFTHNAVGEYGHSAHKLVNAIAKELLPNVWEFIFPTGSHRQPRKNRRNKVPLTKEILKQKKEIFDSCYKDQSRALEKFNDLMSYEFKTGPEIFASD